MPSVQHKDIPDSERHDPKGLSTATNKQIYIASGPNAGSWRRLFESDLDYSDKTKNVFGWNAITDSQYTSASPRAIVASTRTQLTNNALGTKTDTSRLGTIWDVANSRFLINDLNAMYQMHISMKVKAAAAASSPYLATLEVESAVGPTVVHGESTFIKGGGVVNFASFSVPVYLYTAINNQVLRLYFTGDTAMDIYDIEFNVQRTYKEV